MFSQGRPRPLESRKCCLFWHVVLKARLTFFIFWGSCLATLYHNLRQVKFEPVWEHIERTRFFKTESKTSASGNVKSNALHVGHTQSSNSRLGRCTKGRQVRVVSAATRVLKLTAKFLTSVATNTKTRGKVLITYSLKSVSFCLFYLFFLSVIPDVMTRCNAFVWIICGTLVVRLTRLKRIAAFFVC